MPTISQRAVDKIIGYEVSSRSYYDKVLQRPEWPQGASGVTVGIGYDLGYASPAKIESDWGIHVTPEMLAVMKRCSGVTGASAEQLCHQVHDSILIPWDAAVDVFLHKDIPQWTTTVCSRVPHAGELPPDSLGALVSLAYNRGASFDTQGDRYKEMRDIKTHTASYQWPLDPGDIRAMKRLWPNVSGLRKRRDDEAALFELGLSSKDLPPLAKTANENPPNLKHPPVSTNEGGAATTGGAVTTAAAKTASSAGFDNWKIILFVCLGIALTALVVYLLYRARTSIPLLARQKDHPPLEPPNGTNPAGPVPPTPAAPTPNVVGPSS